MRLLPHPPISGERGERLKRLGTRLGESVFRSSLSAERVPVPRPPATISRRPSSTGCRGPSKKYVYSTCTLPISVVKDGQHTSVPFLHRGTDTTEARLSLASLCFPLKTLPCLATERFADSRMRLVQTARVRGRQANRALTLRYCSGPRQAAPLVTSHSQRSKPYPSK